jgi:arsenate reductase
MNKIYYIASCDTCRKIIKNRYQKEMTVFRDIKQDPLTTAELEEMYQLQEVMKVEQKKAQLYKSMNLNKSLTEEDIKNTS